MQDCSKTFVFRQVLPHKRLSFFVCPKVEAALASGPLFRASLISRILDIALQGIIYIFDYYTSSKRGSNPHAREISSMQIGSRTRPDLQMQNLRH